MPQYQQRLDLARSLLVRARDNADARADLVRQARTALLATNAVRAADGSTLPVDDGALADIDARPDSITGAIARIDARTNALVALGHPAIDPAVADTRLRDVVQQSGPAASSDLFALLGQLVLRFISGLRNPGIDPRMIETALGTLGIAVILFIIATLGRALPERVRREILATDSAAVARDDPAVHLRAADAALASGKIRDALHALFLYTIGTLAARDVIRYDPALTDAELLLRASAIPHADELRDLVSMYERAWFGLREPTVDEARRARELALRVAP